MTIGQELQKKINELEDTQLGTIQNEAQREKTE